METKLLAAAKKAEIPIQYILFLPVKDKERGERLIAFISWKSPQGQDSIEHNKNLEEIKLIVKI